MSRDVSARAPPPRRTAAPPRQSTGEDVTPQRAPDPRATARSVFQRISASSETAQFST